ncbi:MAG: metallopeptidase [Lachnospiraceae bacterium]|nr:metallopeptidase [Lachnospiraceae bacterium]
MSEEKRSLQHQKQAALGAKILAQARNELYLAMRFLEPVFELWKWKDHPGIRALGTDGVTLFYQPMQLSQRFMYEPVAVNRLYLHCLLHGLLRHMEGAEGRDAELWDAACDAAAEYIIDHLDYPCVRRLVSPRREAVYRLLEEQLRVVTAEGVYHLLEQGSLEADPMEFLADDHALWRSGDAKEQDREEKAQEFREASEKVKTAMETYVRDQGEKAGALRAAIGVQNRRKMRYREFLRKFARVREEMKIDVDSFDYIFYHLGMEMFGNMPLIEELESKEEAKVRSFVIAVDTSGSTAGDLVRAFLAQTAQILAEVTGESRACEVYVVQADAKVQEAVRIRDAAEMKAYLEQMTVKGFGGTDFRPVFALVEELRARGELKDLQGLIYFTDGYGTYPARRPGYPTAFVFAGADAVLAKVPPWAMRVVIEEDELKEMRG